MARGLVTGGALFSALGACALVACSSDGAGEVPDLTNEAHEPAVRSATIERAPENDALRAAQVEDAHEPLDDAPAAARMAPSAAPSCAASALEIARFPLNGVNGHDWMINNYLDLDTTTGIRDYLGKTGSLARTYDGHAGIDIDVGSFRQMDSSSAIIYAVAPGVVDQVIQDQYDRNTSCASSNWNVIRVRHANGYAVLYGHIKKGSAKVSVGSAVSVGQALAIVGSAGCSTQPHLHLEVQTCSGAPVETLLQSGMWASPPVYDPASDVLDVMLRSDGLPTVDEIKDPAPDPAVVSPGTDLGVGLSLAARGGDAITVSLTSPGGVATTYAWTVPGVARFGHWYPSWHFAMGSALGTWSVSATVNGRVAATRSLRSCTGGTCTPPPKCDPLECNLSCLDCNGSRGTCSLTTHRCVCASKAYCR